MLRNYSSLGPGTSQASSSMNTAGAHNSQQIPMASHTVHHSAQGYVPAEPPVNLASKVAEVFLTAGHAFQKLGDLTLQLHSTVEPDECKWSEKDVDQLRDSLTRFAHELDMISQSVQGRTTKHIKTDIKRRHLMNEDPRRPLSPGIKRQINVAGGVPTKRMNVVPSSGNKQISITRGGVPISGQRIAIPAHAAPQLPQPPLLNEQHFQNQYHPS